METSNLPPPTETATTTTTTTTTAFTVEQVPVSPTKTSRPIPPKPYVENEPEPEPEKVELPESPKQVYATPQRPAPTVEDGEEDEEEKRREDERFLATPPDPPAPAKTEISKPVPLPVEEPNPSSPPPPASTSLPLPPPPPPAAAEISLPPSPPPQTQQAPDLATPPQAATPPPPPPPPTGPFIRPYDSTIDFYDCLEICHQTASPSLQPLLLTPYKSLISSIYCKPYLLFSPGTAFILDCGSGSHSSSPPVVPLYPTTTTTTSTALLPRTPGKAVGYILGPANTYHFIRIYKSDYLPLLDVHYPPPPPPHLLETLGPNRWLLDTLFDPEGAMDLGAEMLAQYPAHFHIDILPGWTGSGWGVGLLGVWEEKVGRGKGVGGVHVGVDCANERAWKWYLKMGFVGGKVPGKEDTRWGVKKLG